MKATVNLILYICGFTKSSLLKEALVWNSENLKLICQLFTDFMQVWWLCHFLYIETGMVRIAVEVA